MSTPGLFLVGVLVTLIVAAALALLSYAAVLDGRYATAQKLEREQETLSAAERDPVVAA
jgi:Tfp pilus assembly protein PilO